MFDDDLNSFESEEPLELPEDREEQEALREIFKALFHFKRVDFTHYRQTTVMRRLHRRMAFSKHSSFREYLARLKTDPAEAVLLCDDILLSFTEFFRDPDAFEVLKQRVFPAICENLSLKSPVRIWVPGCSSGEEVYSLALALAEFFEENKLPLAGHVFGTDISGRHIATARTAVYPEKIRHRISRDRLDRFFDEMPDGFRVTKHIREMCVFAVQDITQDPPLPRIDLVSCRNVLIYFDAAFQEKAVPLFHFALKPSGFLWLGSSESLNHFSELFVPFDKKLNLFTKKLCDTRHLYRFPPLDLSYRMRGKSLPPDMEQRPKSDIGAEIDRYLISRFAPSGILLDGQMQIRRFLGKPAAFMEPTDGEASLKLKVMVKEGLMPDLYLAIEEAKKTGREAKKTNLSFKDGNDVRTVHITAAPLRSADTTEPFFLVLFEPSSSSPGGLLPADSPAPADESLTLAEELRMIKEHLQSIIEEKDSVNQELWAANEEVQSTNEELQSVNEEMEAAKEELESSNEELIALNEELRMKNHALAASEARFRGVFDSTGSGVAVYEAVDDGADFVIVDFNHAAEIMEKVSRRAILGRRVTEVFPGVEKFGLLEVLRKVWRDGRPLSHPIQLYQDDRIRGWRENRVYRLSSFEVVAVYEDLTAQKQFEEALKESEARWQFAVDGNDLGLWDLNLATDKVFFSVQWKNMLGHTEDEIGDTLDEWKKRVHPEDLERTLEDMARHLRGECDIFINEHRMRCKDGSYKWILDRGKIVSRNEAGVPLRMIGTHTDITERRRLEEQLRQSEKMQAVGQLAGGIAHDFNNQLAAVLGYAELLRDEVGRQPDLIGYADNIILGIKRASDLTAQLLAFARKGKYLSIPVDMHRIIFEVVNLLSHSIDKRIEIRQYLRATPAFALGDPTQLQNAVLNLALNARDSMPSGGELIFATDIIELNEKIRQSSDEDIPPGRYLQISVIDSGTGIEKELLPKIFEPFFTTKAPGSGTGMGLAAVYGTAKSHRGAVTVSSTVGVGSTFRLLLPLLDEEKTQSVTEAPPETAVKGNGRLLIVDDEQAVLEVTAEILKRLGYEVFVCRNGQEAAAFYKENRQTVDLVILDVVMPVMSGKETFLALSDINPEVLVLLSSGYSLMGEAQSIMDLGAVGFIQKPFRKSELSLKIANILQTKKSQ